MKILFIVPDLKGYTGYSNYAVALGKELEASGHTVAALTRIVTKDAPFQEFPVLSPPKLCMANLGHIWRSAMNARREIRAFNPDIVHVISEPYVALLPYIVWNSKKRPIFFMTVHGTYAYVPHLLKNPFKHVISFIHVRLGMYLCREIIAVSNFTKNYLESFIGPHEKVRVIYPGVTLPGASRIQQKLESSLLGKKPLRFLTVGALKPRKGVVEAIRGIAAFGRATGIPVAYRVVGDIDKTSPYYDDVLRVAKEENFTGSLDLLGELTDDALAAEYREGDIYMHLALIEGTDFEGFGLGILEGNSYGLPVVVRGAGGTTEAVSMGKSGVLLKSAEPEAVSDAVRSIIEGKSDTPASARAWADEFSIQKMATLIETRYKDALNEKK